MKAWCALCSLLIAVVAVFNLVGVVQRIPPPARHATASGVDAVMRQERRLAGVREALQAHGARGVIGYVTDLPPAQLPHDPAAMHEYFLSQFVLAPWVLEAKFADCAWAVANLNPGASAVQVPAGFRVVRDFGRGVQLLQRTAP